MKLSKTQKGIGITAVIAALVYFLVRGYQRRWQPFNNFGATQWIDGKAGNIAIELVNPSTNVKAGDTIEIEHAGSGYPTGEFKVLRIATKGDNGSQWVVIDHPQIDAEDTAGRFRLVKKAA